jgi:cysteine-rich repeat protein
VCGNGIVEAGESCDDGNTTDGDCCSSTCALEAAGSACSDGNACTQSDVCDGAGRCLPGGATVCDDGDFCTDDPECDPTLGCPQPIAKTGFAGVTCHLDALAADLSRAAPDQVTARARARLTAALGKTRVGVGAAVRAGSGKRAVRKLRGVEAALRRIDRVITAARRKNQIKAPLAGTLAGEVNGALGGARSLLTSPS